MAEVCDPLQVSLSVVGALECVVRRCVGPSGGTVILTKDTGQTLITKHGHGVLTALQLEHPVARMVLECLHSHDRVTADGSKSFILLLAALLRGIRDSVFDSSRARRRHASWKLANQLHAFCLGGLDDVIAHGVAPYTSSLFGPGGCEPESGVLAALVGGYLGGRVSPGKAELLTPLLCDFFTRLGHGDTDDAAATIAFIHSNFSELHTTVSGLHAAQSHVVEGLLLACDWCVWAETDGPVTALLVFERLDARPDESVIVQFEESWTFQTDCVLQERLAAFLRLQVNVMMSAVKQPDGVLEWAGLNAISLLDCCDAAQLDLLCELNVAQTLPMQPLACVAPLTHCRRHQLGGRRYAHVGVTHTSLHTHTLVLCAPAEGELEQSVNASRGVFSMLQYLRQSHTHNVSPRPHMQSPASPRGLTSQSPCPNLLQCMLNSGDVIPVGGAFEFLFHHSVLDSRHGDPESRGLLAEAILSMPRTLLAHRPREFLQHLVHFRNKLVQDRPIREQGSGSEFMWGLGSDRRLCGVCVEPVCSKHQLVASVLQCVIRLLRVETVIHTVRPLALRDREDDDDDDEEDGT